MGILATINITRVINKYLMKYTHQYLNATTQPEQTSGDRESGFENTALFTKNISRPHLITRTKFFETNRMIGYQRTIKNRAESALSDHESSGSVPETVMQRPGHFGEPEMAVSGTFADTILGKQIGYQRTIKQRPDSVLSDHESPGSVPETVMQRPGHFGEPEMAVSETFADTILGKQIGYQRTIKQRPDSVLSHHESPGSVPETVMQRRPGHAPPMTNFPERHINLTKAPATGAPDLVLRKSTMVDAKDDLEHTKELTIKKDISSELSEKISDKDISEKTSGGIDVIANEVYRIIEKRIMIEKERRGFR
ncbi:MAG: hypothetical protein C4B59_06305 [Candidatus Methanogaster sp.]|uniref:Uncharacterized protein n=1 Tax=Candidatus Methanogaster sp. TaxID=3386292 RepID=A0AC61L2T0_9EURY|nr:MAG: hypothetical protein C4B59_06305 [ANME-2 cluster archaeon]